MTATAGAGRLIERERELRALAGAIEQARAGEGSLVLVEGEAGIGKSSMCSEARRLAEADGMLALSARGGELEHDFPFGVVRQIFERLLRDAAPSVRRRLMAGPAQLATAAIGDSAVEVTHSLNGLDHGLYWLTSNLAERSPLTLIVDDAHWADAATLRFLLYLARRIDSLPVLMVVSARPGGPPAHARVVGGLGAEPTATRIALEPLTPQGSAALLTSRVAGPVPERLALVSHVATGGNPFFLSEVADSIGEVTGMDEDRAIEHVRSLSPPAVTRSILVRLGREPEDTRATAEALAVLGDGASSALIAVVSGRPEDVVISALSALADAGIVAYDGPTAFTHPIVRTTVYNDVPAVRRRALHRAAAQALIAHSAPVDAVAHHLALVDPASDPEAAAMLRLAGERALERDSLSTAVRMLTRAADEPPPEEARAEVLTLLGEAELRAGLPEPAADHLAGALAAEPTSPVRVRAAIALASATISSEGPDPALSLLSEQASLLQGEDALRLDVERAVLGMWVRGATQVDWLDDLVAGFSQLPGDTMVERMALGQAALGAAYDPTASAAAPVELARRALARGKLLEEQTVDGIAVGMATYALVLGEDFATAEDEISAAIADARARGSILGFASAGLLGGQVALARGALAEAAGHFEAAVDAALTLEESPIAQRCLAFAEAWLVESLLALGDQDGAGEIVARADAAGHFDRTEFVWSLYGRGLLRLEQRRPREAADDLLAVGEAARAGAYEDRRAPWRQWAAIALAAAGDAGRAVELADEQLRVASAWTDAAHGSALHVRALVGKPDEAEPILARAAALLSGSEQRLERARTLVDWGFALRRVGQRRRAQSVLELGLDLAARCEAAPLIDRARRELIALGSRPRRLMFSGVEGLTGTERRVAGMAAEGLTNRAIAQALFVTQKTVETHLRNAYRKLDISSRQELAGALSRSAER
jgi:DNA-binding CsgD family transcriptional regulator